MRKPANHGSRAPEPRRRVRTAACVGFVTLLALTGCQGHLRRYVDARCDDLSDCARFRIGLGLGLYADAEVTSFVKPAVGFMDASLAPSYTAGWDPRPDQPTGRVRTAAFPALLVGWPFYGYGETKAGYGDTHPYLRGAVAPFIFMGNGHVERRSWSLFGLHRLIPNPRLAPSEDDPPPPVERDIDKAWVAASATAGIVTADLGFNPLQCVDFVAGLFGFDFAGDDFRGGADEGAPPSRHPPPPPEPAPVPETTVAPEAGAKQ